MQWTRKTIACHTPQLTHADVSRIADNVDATGEASTVVLDLSSVQDTDTAALAALILLRRSLLNRGGDLVLRGIRNRFAHLYHLNRMNDLLPQTSEQEAAVPSAHSSPNKTSGTTGRHHLSAALAPATQARTRTANNTLSPRHDRAISDRSSS